MAATNGMTNGTAHALETGHFLFTSESVGEGHPGWFSFYSTSYAKHLMRLFQIKFATKYQMPS